MKYAFVVYSFLVSSFVHSNENEVEQINVYDETYKSAKERSKNEITFDDILTKRTVTNFADLTLHTPTFGTKKSGRAVAITVNGIGFNGGFHNPSLEPAIALYIDGSYIPRQSIISTGIPDITSASFTEGIRSVYPITSGIGTIDISTIKPKFTKNFFRLEAGAGSDSFRSVGAGANIVLGNKSAASFYISDMEDNGNLKNFHTNESIDAIDNTLGYIRLLHEFDSGLSVYLNHYQTKDSNGWDISGQTHHHNFNLSNDRLAIFNSVIPIAYDILSIQQRNDSDIDLPFSLNFEGTSNDVENIGEHKNKLTSITIEKRIGSLDVKGITSFFDSSQEYIWDTDNTDYSLSSQEIYDAYKTYSQEFRFKYTSEVYDVDGGVYFSDTETDFNYATYLGDDFLVLSAFGAASQEQRNYLISALNNNNLFGQHLSTDSNNNEESNRYTTYVNIDFESNFRIGVNLSQIEKEFTKANDGLCSFDTRELPINQCTPTRMRGILDPTFFRGSDKYSELISSLYIYKGWTINNENYFYSNIGRSQKPGGFNSMQAIGFGPGQSPSINELEFEKETNYSLDIGYKSTFDKLSLQFNIYGNIVNDYQLNYFNNFGFDVRNAKRVKSFGTKIDVDYSISHNLQFLGKFNYAKTYYSEHNNALCPPTENRTLENCSHLTLGQALSQGTLLTSDLSGTDLRTPRLTSNFALKNQFNFWGFNINHSVEYRFTGNRRSTEYDIPRSRQGGFGIFNYNVNLDFYKNLSLIFTARNITDKRVITLEYPSTIVRPILSTGPQLANGETLGLNALVNDPRRFEATLRYTF